jgi:hypothetical protein
VTTVIVSTTTIPMPPPPTQYHQGERSASPKPARLWRTTRRTVVAMSVDKRRLAASASNVPIR